MTDILCKWLNDELTISQQVGKNSNYFEKSTLIYINIRI